MSITYVPLLKTRDSELRGVTNLDADIKDSITPLWEVTRARKAPRDKKDGAVVGDIRHQLVRIKKACEGRPFILDLTGHDKYENDQIREFRNPKGEYRKWRAFLIEIAKDYPEIIPAIQVSDEGIDTADEYYSAIEGQVRRLGRMFDHLAYRMPLTFDEYEGDLKAIRDSIDSSTRLTVVIDAGFIPQKKSRIYAASCDEVVSNILSIRPGTDVVVAGTSFPSNPTEYGGETDGTFDLEEIIFFSLILEKHNKVIYGDYATVHDTPSNQAGGSGWVPRIDIPGDQSIKYHRSRKESTEAYSDAYYRTGIAMAKDDAFREVAEILGHGNWGVRQIAMAADGTPPGLSPSFWISVRINIHISLRALSLSGD